MRRNTIDFGYNSSHMVLWCLVHVWFMNEWRNDTPIENFLSHLCIHMFLVYDQYCRKKNVRILSNKVYNDHTNELFKRLKILKVKQINIFQIALHVYKHDNNSLPNCLDGMFQTNSTHHNHNTRNRNQLCTPNHRLVKTEHNIRFLVQQIIVC